MGIVYCTWWLSPNWALIQDLIETNATRSIRAAAVGCLNQDKEGITRDEVLEVIADAFASLYQVGGERMNEIRCSE